MRYGYSPGCSNPADDTAPAVDRDVAGALGLTLEEVGEPGDTSAGTLELNGIAGYARVGRLLALAARRLEARGDASSPPSVVTSCSECFRNLSRARRSLAEHPDLREKVAEELGAEGLALDPRSVRVRHLLCVLCEDAGADAVRARATRPLTGLRVAAYYGCFPIRDGRADRDPSDGPWSSPLEELLAALGADVVEFPLRAHCCGGRSAAASEEAATSLQQRILRSATDHRADVIAVVCPRCRRNLEDGQEPVNRRFGTRFALPVRSLTELAAQAFGLEEARPASGSPRHPAVRGGIPG